MAQLHQLWSTDLGADINAAPILANDLNIGGTRTDVVYVGTENGVFFALRTDGRILWYRGLGVIQMDCPTTNNKYGVSASAVFDRATNRVFVMGGDGFMYALDPATGANLAGWPVKITADPLHEVAFSAPTLFGGKLYVELASHCDRRPYHGRITSIDTTTRAKTKFYVTGSKTGPDGGGIWGWGGASIDPVDGDVYVATGNAFGNPENSFYADHVVRLSSALQVKASHAPGTLIIDDDFGSTPMLFHKPGCPPQFVTEQKNGYLYLYDRDTIATGYRQRIAVRPDGFFIGVPGLFSRHPARVRAESGAAQRQPLHLRDDRLQVDRELHASAAVADDRRWQRQHSVDTDGGERRRLLQRRQPGEDPRLRCDHRGAAVVEWRRGRRSDLRHADRHQRPAVRGFLRQPSARLGFVAPPVGARRGSRHVTDGGRDDRGLLEGTALPLRPSGPAAADRVIGTTVAPWQRSSWWEAAHPVWRPR